MDDPFTREGLVRTGYTPCTVRVEVSVTPVRLVHAWWVRSHTCGSPGHTWRSRSQIEVLFVRGPPRVICISWCELEMGNTRRNRSLWLVGLKSFQFLGGMYFKNGSNKI